MTSLVTLAEARAHLRIDDFDEIGGPDDDWMNTMIPAVSEAVLGWLKDSWRAYVLELDSEDEVVFDSDEVPVPVLDSDGEPTPKPSVKAAVLIELERQYRFRGGEGEGDMPVEAGHGYTLGKGATYILTPLRKATVA